MSLEIKLNRKLNIKGIDYMEEEKLPTIYRVLRRILFKKPPIQSNCGDNGLVLIGETYPYLECAYYGWQLFKIPEGTAIVEIYTERMWYDRRISLPAEEPEVETSIKKLNITFHQEGKSSRMAQRMIEDLESIYVKKMQLAMENIRTNPALNV